MRWHWRCAGASTGDALALALAMRWLWRWRCTGTAGGQLDQPAPQSLFAPTPHAGFPPLRGPNQRLAALAWPGPNIIAAAGHSPHRKSCCCSVQMTRLIAQSLETGRFLCPPFSARQPVWKAPLLQSPLIVAPFSAVCPFHKTASLSRARASPPCSPGPFASLRAAACARPLDRLAVLLSCCSSWGWPQGCAPAPSPTGEAGKISVKLKGKKCKWNWQSSKL